MRTLLFGLALILLAPAFAQGPVAPSNGHAAKRTVQPRKTTVGTQKLAPAPGPRPPVTGTPAALRAEWMD